MIRGYQPLQAHQVINGRTMTIVTLLYRVRMLNVRSILFCSILLFLIQQEGKGQPNWVKEEPTSTQYYIGVAEAIKSGNTTKYRDKARDLALSRLASQIEVNVSTISESTIRKIGGNVQDFFSLIAKSEARHTIEEYEVVDTWEDENKYWVYLRVSKAEYQEKLSRKTATMTTRVYTAYKSGLQQYSNQNYAAALSSFVKGIEDAVPYLARLEPINYDGKPVDLFSELEFSLQSLLDELRIERISGPSNVAKSNQPTNTPFLVKITDKNTTRPVEGVPVEFLFGNGNDGEIESPVYTHRNGVAESRLLKVSTRQKILSIGAKISVLNLVENPSDSLIQRILNGFNNPEVKYNIRVSGVPVFIENTEVFLGKASNKYKVGRLVREQLTRSGLTVTEDLNDATFYIEVMVTTREGSETDGLFSSFCDIEIRVMNVVTGKETASYSLTDIKGLDFSYKEAGEVAINASIDSLRNEIINKLINSVKE